MEATVYEKVPVTPSEDFTLFREISQFVLYEWQFAMDFAVLQNNCASERTLSPERIVSAPLLHTSIKIWR